MNMSGMVARNTALPPVRRPPPVAPAPDVSDFLAAKGIGAWDITSAGSSHRGLGTTARFAAR